MTEATAPDTEAPAQVTQPAPGGPVPEDRAKHGNDPSVPGAVDDIGNDLEGIAGKTVRETVPAEFIDQLPEKFREARWAQPKLGAFLQLWKDNGDITQLMADMFRDKDGNRVATQKEIEEEIDMIPGMVLVGLARRLERDIMAAASKVREEAANDQGKKNSSGT